MQRLIFWCKYTMPIFYSSLLLLTGLTKKLNCVDNILNCSGKGDFSFSMQSLIDVTTLKLGDPYWILKSIISWLVIMVITMINPIS